MDLEFALEVLTLFSAPNVAAVSRCGEWTSKAIIPLNSPPARFEHGDVDCSLDGKWVLYSKSGSEKGIWKTPIEGGKSVRLTDVPAWSLAVSPDGKTVAYSYLNNGAVPSSGTATVPFEGGKPTKQLDSFSFRVLWTTNCRSLLYLKNDAGVSNVWSQRVGSGVSKQIKHFQSDIIFDFAVSPDGKWIAFTRGTSNRDVVLVGDAK